MSTESFPRRLLKSATRFAAYVVMPKFTTGALVVARDGRRVVLVRKRSSPIEWGFPAGYLFYRESILDTARRELAEETGLSAEVTTAHHVRSHRQPWMMHIDHVFLVHASGEPHTRDAIEIAETAWFDVDDLPPLAREARLALEQIPDLLTRPVAGAASGDYSNRDGSPAP